VLSILLVLCAAVFYAAPTAENVPDSKPLNLLPRNINGWVTVSESQPEKEILELLRADDTLTRIYRNDQGASASLFLAFFKSQRAGASPHSPKVCLPGSGWLPERSDRIDLSVPSRDRPITVNRYIVSRGEQKSLVLFGIKDLTG
jgi:EpsI family protein